MLFYRDWRSLNFVCIVIKYLAKEVIDLHSAKLQLVITTPGKY